MLRWLLRECVRANPLYVISAALLSYGVLQLTTGIDPQVGKAGGILLGLGLLHLYEGCLLLVATVVLRDRARHADAAVEGIGRDCHGLTIVAGIFLAGSFLALDEPLAHWPAWGPWAVLLALALAAAKLAWYARLPGVKLPAAYRYAALGLIAGPASGPLLGAPKIRLALGDPAAQGCAWLLNLLALGPLFLLSTHEARRGPAPRTAVEPDPMVTRVCGGWLLGICVLAGLAHLVACDWVFDRPADLARLLPGATVLLSIALVFAWHYQLPREQLFWLAACAPAVMLQWVWVTRSPWVGADVLEALVSPAAQMTLANVAFYAGLAHATRAKCFLWGISGAACAPAGTGFAQLRDQIPHFKALATAALGFAMLLAAMLVSLYREHLLRALAPVPPPVPAPAPKVPETTQELLD